MRINEAWPAAIRLWGKKSSRKLTILLEKACESPFNVSLPRREVLQNVLNFAALTFRLETFRFNFRMLRTKDCLWSLSTKLVCPDSQRVERLREYRSNWNSLNRLDCHSLQCEVSVFFLFFINFLCFFYLFVHGSIIHTYYLNILSLIMWYILFENLNGIFLLLFRYDRAVYTTLHNSDTFKYLQRLYNYSLINFYNPWMMFSYNFKYSCTLELPTALYLII